MKNFHAAIDQAAWAEKFCVVRNRDGELVARCPTEHWSNAITFALNFAVDFAEEVKEDTKLLKGEGDD